MLNEGTWIGKMSPISPSPEAGRVPQAPNGVWQDLAGRRNDHDLWLNWLYSTWGGGSPLARSNGRLWTKSGVEDHAYKIDVSTYNVALVSAALGEDDNAFELRDKTCEKQSYYLTGLRTDAQTDPLPCE